MLPHVIGNLVGLKGAGSAVKVSSKIAKTGATKVDKVLEAGEKTATNHVNKGISKGKKYIKSLSGNKDELALIGIAEDIENTYNVKNTSILKKRFKPNKINSSKLHHIRIKMHSATLSQPT